MILQWSQFLFVFGAHVYQPKPSVLSAEGFDATLVLFCQVLSPPLVTFVQGFPWTRGDCVYVDDRVLRLRSCSE